MSVTIWSRWAEWWPLRALRTPDAGRGREPLWPGLENPTWEVTKRPHRIHRRDRTGGRGMAKVIVHTDTAPTPSSPYSQAVRSGGFVFVSGQGPVDAKTGEIVGTTIQEQTAQCLRNVSAILQAAGTSLDKVVSAT